MIVKAICSRCGSANVVIDKKQDHPGVGICGSCGPCFILDVCEHGTALDVHCCNCHSGFIFEQRHVCRSTACGVPSSQPADTASALHNGATMTRDDLKKEICDEIDKLIPENTDLDEDDFDTLSEQVEETIEEACGVTHEVDEEEAEDEDPDPDDVNNGSQKG